MYQKAYQNLKKNKIQAPIYFQVSSKMTEVVPSKIAYFSMDPSTNGRSSASRIHIPPQQQTTEVPSHWRLNFMVATLPFLLWGYPTHLLFRQRRITSTREWFRYLCPCSSPIASFFTILMVLISILLNAFTLYMLGYFLNSLLIKGLLDDVFFEVTIDLLRTLAVIIPLNLFWFRGYQIRNFIASFDRFTTHLQNAIESVAEGEDPKPLKEIPSCRPKLALFYLLILSTHVLHILSDSYDRTPAGQQNSTQQGQNTTQEKATVKSLEAKIWSYMFSYSLAIYCSLIFPLYCVFCWGVKYELGAVVAYIKILIGSRAPPKYAHFDEFKRCYRKIADDIMRVNSIFSVYLSAVAVVLAVYIFGEARNLGWSLLQAFFPGILGTVLGFFARKSGGGGGGAAPTTAVPMILSPFEIRLLVADGLIMLFYLALFWLTYWQAVKVNDEVRFLHVWLNDFVTEPGARLTADLHNGFTFLKWYIHSRLEQERPALLNILALSLVPSLKTRLIQYRVFH